MKIINRIRHTVKCFDNSDVGTHSVYNTQMCSPYNTDFGMMHTTQADCRGHIEFYRPMSRGPFDVCVRIFPPYAVERRIIYTPSIQSMPSWL